MQTLSICWNCQQIIPCETLQWFYKSNNENVVTNYKAHKSTECNYKQKIYYCE